MPSNTVENYLKAIYHLSQESDQRVQTNHLANHLEVKSSTVTDMLKKLEQAGWVTYEPYKGVSLTPEGNRSAIDVIRKHRLWEVFLVDKLQFSWSDVHPVAEQLEHVNSKELVERLDAFLGYPKWDPHGDPIPDKYGNIEEREQTQLSLLVKDTSAVMLGVSEDNKSLLEYLEKINLRLGVRIKVLEVLDFDGSMSLEVDNKFLQISQKAANKVIVRQL